MKDYLLKLTQYSVWANLKFIKMLNDLDDRVLLASADSSFANVLETCKHIWFGELGWMSRMQGNGWQTKELDNFQGQPKDLFLLWQLSSKAYVKFVETEDLKLKVEFVHDEVAYSIGRADIILTIINHGNYHRGQIVTMLRQLGVKKIPKTDYIEWVREQKRIRDIS